MNSLWNNPQSAHSMLFLGAVGVLYIVLYLGTGSPQISATVSFMAVYIGLLSNTYLKQCCPPIASWVLAGYFLWFFIVLPVIKYFLLFT